MGGGFCLILLQHLHHNLGVTVHSRWQSKLPNTLRAEWDVASECAAAICGKGGGNLARQRWGCTGGLHIDVFGPVEHEGSLGGAPRRRRQSLQRVGGGRG
jgi:hypothetical protein